MLGKELIPRRIHHHNHPQDKNMQSFLKSLADVPGITLADRYDNYTILVTEDSVPTQWIAWFTYHSGYVPAQNDNYYWIVPSDGVGAWKRVNSSQDIPQVKVD